MEEKGTEAKNLGKEKWQNVTSLAPHRPRKVALRKKAREIGPRGDPPGKGTGTREAGT